MLASFVSSEVKERTSVIEVRARGKALIDGDDLWHLCLLSEMDYIINK